jgi:hypothetical protein
MKRHALVLLLAALAACEGTYNENDQADGVRDEQIGERDRAGDDAAVGGEDEFGVRRTTTGDRDTTGMGGEDDSLRPTGRETPTTTTPSGTQPTTTTPGTTPGTTMGQQPTTVQLVDPNTKSQAGTLQIQSKGEDVQVKADLQQQAGAAKGATYTVHVAKDAKSCDDANNLLKTAGPALGTATPGGDWKTVPNLEMSGPDSVMGKAIVLKPQQATGQPAGGDQQVLCGMVQGGTTQPATGTQPTGTQPAGGMQPSGTTQPGGTTGGSAPK